MLAQPLQQPSVVPWRSISLIKMQGCLPESLTNKQTPLGLHGDARLLTIAFPSHPVSAQTQLEWKQQSQLSFSGPAVELRGESQKNRVHLKQGRNCRPNTGLLVLRLTHALPRGGHVHGPADVPRAAALHCGQRRHSSQEGRGQPTL